MFLRPKLHALATVGLALLPFLACTLTSDPYNPPSIDALELAPGNGGGSSQPAKPEGEPNISCDSEPSSCEIQLRSGSSCDTDLDCQSQVCVSGACAAPSCDDGRSNGEEEGVDCGGPCALACGTSVSCRDGVQNGAELGVDCGGGTCPGCAPGNRCDEGVDCLTNVCGAGGTCSPPSCSDGVKNQDETGVDCGGACPDCAAAQPCAIAGDCQSGVCGGAGCPGGIDLCCQAPSCDDRVRNGNEPVTDCGNAACGGCPIGSPCSAGVQCESALCQAGACRVQPCANGVRNGSETDTDCGGNDPRCVRCAVGDSCAVGGDCASGSCINGECSNCADRQRNGTETGVDCGGVCGACGPGEGCDVDAECQSGACQDGRCCGGVRGDCTRCARRLVTAINCSSNGAAATPNCEAFLDCLAANPALCPVRYAPGCSENPGDVCDHNDFGGVNGPGVGLADAIIGSAQCEF